MPELLLVGGRTSRLHLTARGGFAIGLLLALGVFAVAAGFKTHADAAQAAQALGQREQAHAQVLQAAQAQTQGLCRVLLHWVARSQQGTARLRQLEAAFPDFKTDAYRITQLALRSEAERQQAEIQSLQQALQTAPTGTPACAVASQVSGSPLWSGGELALYRQGWRWVLP